MIFVFRRRGVGISGTNRNGAVNPSSNSSKPRTRRAAEKQKGKLLVIAFYKQATPLGFQNQN
jgi:hypothetical protein